MKSIIKMLIALIATGVIATVALPLWAAENNTTETYVLATHASYKPWEFINKNGELAGIEIDMVHAIEKSQDINIKVVNMPWTAAIASTAHGKVDGVFGGMSVTKKRKKVVDFTRPIYRVNFAVLVQKDSDLNIISALSHGATTAAQPGTTGAHWVRNNLIEAGYDTHLKLLGSTPTVLQAVVTGKVDSAFIDGPSAHAYVEEMPLKIVGTVGSRQYYAWAVSEGSSKLLHILNAGITEMIKSGKLAQIYSKWGIPPTIPQRNPK